jgi:UDP-GlcNAc3NAcA epimerase
LELDYKEAPAQRLGEMIIKISGFLQTIKPDAVLVYGDTDTTLAAALAARKMQIKLIHVEAGERSYNRAMPEEQNRILTDAVSDILFCASRAALENLGKEHNSGTIVYSGDLMKDLLLSTEILFQNPMQGDYIYCTIHRNYTNQNPAKLQELLKVLATLKQIIFFPVHPSTQTAIKKVDGKTGIYSNIRLLPPVSYADSIRYQKFAQAIITDSGGVQKEAYWLQKRCITIRKETEWTATLKHNWNQLVYDELSTIPQLLLAPLQDHNPQLYGDGNAAICMADTLIHML